MQGREHLDDLLKEITQKNDSLAKEKNCNRKNIFLKIAPDLISEELKDIFDLVIKYKIDGIAATNTTISRNNLLQESNEEGGLSGKPLLELSNNILKELNELNTQNKNSKILLIGIGGVFSRNDYNEKLSLGADLVQVYTGFIYEGINITKNILKK